jgi:hypothetical protein
VLVEKRKKKYIAFLAMEKRVVTLHIENASTNQGNMNM